MSLPLIEDLLTVQVESIDAAFRAGMPVWLLMTAGTDGDDLLVGDEEVVRREVQLRHSDVEVDPPVLPSGWTLERLPFEDWCAMKLAYGVRFPTSAQAS